jgi:hypothetical protein
MIDRETVQEELDNNLTETSQSEAQLVRRVAEAIVRLLKENSPDYWKNYGAYWWGLQEVLKHHAPRAYREWVEATGGNGAIGSDPEMQKAHDYGSDGLNITAAQMYLLMRAEEGNMGADAPHVVTLDGDDRLYIPGVGFVDDREG